MDLADLRRIAEAHVPDLLAIADSTSIQACRTASSCSHPTPTSRDAPSPTAFGRCDRSDSLASPFVGGPRGVIVNKTTGKVLILGSGIPDEVFVAMYEKGYCFDRYDLVITGVTRLEAALDTLMKLRISVVDVTYEHGKVWRILRPTTSALRRQLLHVDRRFTGRRVAAVTLRRAERHASPPRAAIPGTTLAQATRPWS